MAYVAPINRSTGDLITASIWNQDVVANPTAIYAGAMALPSQVAGGIVFASSATQLGCSSAWTDYAATSTIVGWASFVANRKYVMYRKIGKLVLVSFYFDGTSNATSVSFTLPFTAVTLASFSFCGALYEAINNGAYATIGTYDLPCAGAIVTCYSSAAQGAWAASGSKSVKGQFWYEAAA